MITSKQARVIRVSELSTSAPSSSLPSASPSSESQKPPNIINDVIERIPRRQEAPSAPTSRAFTAADRTTGFPRARIIMKKSSIKSESDKPPEIGNEREDRGARGEEGEWVELKRQIDEQNRTRMAQMSEEEILEAREVLESSFDPSLIQKIRERTERPLLAEVRKDSSKLHTSESSTAPRLSNFAHVESDSLKSDSFKTYDTSSAFESHLKSFFPANVTIETPEWTNPILPSESAFYSSSAEIDASTMRFDLDGMYISPEKGLKMPTHEGLHHHGMNPGVAGYTVSELAILLRSRNAGQRCIALKAINGILVSLTKGAFAWDVEQSLWDIVENDVLDILQNLKRDLDTNKVGNLSVMAYFEDLWTKWLDSGGPEQWQQRVVRRKQDQLRRMWEKGEIEIVQNEDTGAQ